MSCSSLRHAVIGEAEKLFFPTNRPNAHEAQFVRTIVEWYLNQAIRRGFLVYKNSKLAYAPQVLAFYKYCYGDEDRFSDAFLTFHMPDYSELDELAKKDDEVFPPPEPIRVEVAGAILNFTTDQGVLVVYLDCSYAGNCSLGWDLIQEGFILLKF